jgi:hypothetical protein
MADEFNAVLNSMREAPIRDQIEGLSEVIEKMMILIMSIPERVDAMVSDLNNQINGLNSKITNLESRIASGGTVAPAASAPISGGAGPGAPPPPPGAPAPRPQAPANPISLRSSIMGELKELFAKRRALSE